MKKEIEIRHEVVRHLNYKTDRECLDSVIVQDAIQYSGASEELRTIRNNLEQRERNSYNTLRSLGAID